MRHYFNTNKVLSVTALAIGAITIFFACKKDDKADDQRDNQTLAAAQREAEVNAVYEDNFTVVFDETSRESDLRDGRTAPGAGSQNARFCATLITSYTPQDAVTWPKTYTLDFGAEGCTDSHNRTRKGKMIIVMSKPFFVQDATATITFDNYSVNGIQVQGTQTITNQSSNNGLKFTYAVEGGLLTFPGDTIMIGYSGSRTLTQTDGAGTPWVLEDDVYELSGSATLQLGSSLTATIATATALERKLSCAWIGKGVLTMTAAGQAVKIDYGNGDCDDKAVLTLGAKTKEITLQR